MAIFESQLKRLAEICYTYVNGSYAQRTMVLFWTFFPSVLITTALLAFLLSAENRETQYFSMAVARVSLNASIVFLAIGIAYYAICVELIRRGEDHPAILHSGIALATLLVNIAIYLTGSVSGPVTIWLATMATTIFLLLDMRSAIYHMAWMVGLYLLAALAAQFGSIPYSPLVIHSPDLNTSADWVWVTGSLLLSINALLIVFGVGVLVTMKNEKHAIELETLSWQDSLTGLGNRREFDDKFRTELSRANRQNLPLSLGLVDLDRFKHINDAWGHQVGDGVLQGVGKMLKASSREYDIACRIGGEEFALILPNTKSDDAAAIMERLRKQIESNDFLVEGERLNVTTSIGVASNQVNETDESDLFKLADEALYRAKKEGRNRVIVAYGSTGL